MNDQRFALDRHSRAAFVAAASICFAGAFALTPTEVRSRLDASTIPTLARVPAGVPAEPRSIAPARDPFVARAPDDDAATVTPRAAAARSPLALPPFHLGPLPANAGAGTFPFPRPPLAVARVTAIALGDHPRAIVDSGGSTRILSIGDALDGTRVIAIDRAGIVLADGNRYAFPSKGSP